MYTHIWCWSLHTDRNQRTPIIFSRNSVLLWYHKQYRLVFVFAFPKWYRPVSITRWNVSYLLCGCIIYMPECCQFHWTKFYRLVRLVGSVLLPKMFTSRIEGEEFMDVVWPTDGLLQSLNKLNWIGEGSLYSQCMSPGQCHFLVILNLK